MSEPNSPKLQKWFSEQNIDLIQICQVFENIPGVSFFVKDTNHRLLYFNHRFLPRIGVASNDDLFGKTDFDVFPPRLAEHFRKDDRTVIETKQPLLNILELVFNSKGLPDWYLTNKYPLFNFEGHIVGIVGTVRPYGQENTVHNKELKWERDDEIGRAVSFIRENFRSNLEISSLVKISGLNQRKLHRGFLELFGVAPMQFITRTRIEAACDDLLTTRKKLSQVAEDNGFYDQSSFTQHFRRQMKVTPLKYRKQKGFV